MRIPTDTNLLYRRIGEFVVSFQWLESRVRETGWLLTDPQRACWPPLILRQESNQQLLDKVCQLFSTTMDKLATEDALARKPSFESLIQRLHGMRRYRNKLLHSAYIVLESGGDVQGVYRINPKLQQVDDEYILDSEMLTPESIERNMKEMAQIAFELNFHYIQLVHWSERIAAVET
ncbi:hypothetical protein J2T02_002561 [Chitinophaga terrae (ex Kim and Jung 2007)]|uniref:hypothetical protein n=1 Tax=Chitinophaga terrae (ex Kim and Jung 2007) TaxID=408074 RepID=UPI00278AAFB5|nr:hypothetical protein [Chitinophaga terrae (ex Kim and Jung 2007)]MDQ0107442.1 hypothetical protein [Chitinophaga terrae (ex Kim and Jung 2007)]